jgi:antirestriction protein ArdC
MATKTAVDKYELLTNKILELMSQGIKPWQKSWYGNPCQNAVTGHIYRGVNPLLCTVDMLVNNWQDPYFLTYKQAEEKGWNIRKGSKSVWIKFGGTVGKENKETGDIEFYACSKWFNVFNINQVEGEGIAEHINAIEKAKDINPDKPIPSADQFIKMQLAKINHTGDRAFYSPDLDRIVVPKFEHFTSATAYYSTLIHEHIHWTGHKDRLNRNLTGGFGSKPYAFEELVAELGAVFTCNDICIDYDLQNHANYLNNWIQVLQQDNKAFMKAAGLAQKATKHLLEKAGICEN